MDRIIMTEVYAPLGKYILFTRLSGGDEVAEVDRVDGKYRVFVFSPEFPGYETRTRRDSAIQLAQDRIRQINPDVEFKWNVISKRIKRA